jgi:phosphoglycerate dehydrogenase-like enzyme
MSFKLLLLAPDLDPSWPDKIRQAVPGVDVKAFADPQDAGDDITDADAAYGTVPPELLARAKKLRWICAARAGLVERVDDRGTVVSLKRMQPAQIGDKVWLSAAVRVPRG